MVYDDSGHILAVFGPHTGEPVATIEEDPPHVAEPRDVKADQIPDGPVDVPYGSTGF